MFIESALDLAGVEPNPAALKSIYPPRDSQAKPGLIDLTAYYNAALTEAWHGKPKNDLASLPNGAQNFAGVEYDARGVIQLSSKSLTAKRFSARINGIKIQQKCARLHFLHSANFGSPGNDGQPVCSYILHYASNHMQLEIPIMYGRDIYNWHTPVDEELPAELVVAWTGANQVSAAAHRKLHLYTTTWVNVAPGVEIESIDFVSAMGVVAPFLIAITAE